MNALENATFVLRIAVEQGEITQRELLEYLGELIGAVGYDYVPTRGIESNPGPGNVEPSNAERLNQKISKRFQSLMYPGGIDTDDEFGIAADEPDAACATNHPATV